MKIIEIVKAEPDLWPALAGEMRTHLANPRHTRERQALVGGDH
jgi:hypothetical protein